MHYCVTLWLTGKSGHQAEHCAHPYFSPQLLWETVIILFTCPVRLSLQKASPLESLVSQKNNESNENNEKKIMKTSKRCSVLFCTVPWPKSPFAIRWPRDVGGVNPGLTRNLYKHSLYYSVMTVSAETHRRDQFYYLNCLHRRSWHVPLKISVKLCRRNWIWPQAFIESISFPCILT